MKKKILGTCYSNTFVKQDTKNQQATMTTDTDSNMPSREELKRRMKRRVKIVRQHKKEEKEARDRAIALEKNLRKDGKRPSRTRGRETSEPLRFGCTDPRRYVSGTYDRYDPDYCGPSRR